jgi:Protein of unknown function (DUF3551)
VIQPRWGVYILRKKAGRIVAVTVRDVARVSAVLVAAAGIILVVTVRDAVARSNYPYCAMSRGADVGYQDCSYATFAACLEEIRGLGGYCRPNARYAPAPPVRRNPNRRPPTPQRYR